MKKIFTLTVLLFPISFISIAQPQKKELEFSKISETTGIDFSLYGTTNELTIKVNSAKEKVITFELRNMLGQLVIKKSMEIKSGLTEYKITPTDTIDKGLYFASLIANNTAKTQRVYLNE